MSDEMPSQQQTGRRRTPAKQTPESPAISDWKNHPVLIVGGAVAATAFACLTYFNEFALPQRTARLQDEAIRATEEAKRLAVDLAANQKLVHDSQARIVELMKRERGLERLLSEARTVDMFQSGSAYPNGFATVKVGMSASDVYAAYPASAIHPNERGYISVKVANSPFSSATYYYDEESPGGEITHILFQTKYAFDDDEGVDLVKRLSENLGKALEIPPGRYAWPANDGVNVFVDGDFGYTVMQSGFRPANWPAEKELAIVCGIARDAREKMCPVPKKK